MAQLELKQEYRSLIENVIKNNPRYIGNEDLIEDFCSETFKRSYSILNSIGDINNLEIYLRKIASSAILEVLKSSGRLIRSRSGYTKINHQVSTYQTNAYEIDLDGDIMFDIPVPEPNIEEKLTKKEEVENIRNIIKKIDSRNKGKNFWEIFILKYIKEMKQSNIALELDISHGEVSKRLLELAKKIQKESEEI